MDVRVGVLRARVAVPRGRAVIARKHRRHRVGAQVGASPQDGNGVVAAVGAHVLGIRWFDCRARPFRHAGRGVDPRAGTLRSNFNGTAGAVKEPRVGIVWVGVELGAARVAVAVKGKGWRRRQRRLLRLWRRRRRAGLVGHALVGLGADLLRRARPVVRTIGGVGSQAAVGRLAHVRVERVVEERLGPEAAVLAHAIVGRGARVVGLYLARVLAEAALRALRRVRADGGQPRALAAVAAPGVARGHALARGLALGEGRVRWQRR